MVLKAIASAVSIGSGFRGGLFFASLFLGALVGKFFGGVEALVMPAHAVPGVVSAVVGMSAVAAAIIGGAADDGVPGARGHRQPAADDRRAGRRASSRR